MGAKGAGEGVGHRRGWRSRAQTLASGRRRFHHCLASRELRAVGSGAAGGTYLLLFLLQLLDDGCALLGGEISKSPLPHTAAPSHTPRFRMPIRFETREGTRIGTTGDKYGGVGGMLQDTRARETPTPLTRPHAPPPRTPTTSATSHTRAISRRDFAWGTLGRCKETYWGTRGHAGTPVRVAQIDVSTYHQPVHLCKSAVRFSQASWAWGKRRTHRFSAAFRPQIATTCVPGGVSNMVPGVVELSDVERMTGDDRGGSKLRVVGCAHLSKMLPQSPPYPFPPYRRASDASHTCADISSTCESSASVSDSMATASTREPAREAETAVGAMSTSTRTRRSRWKETCRRTIGGPRADARADAREGARTDARAVERVGRG